MFWNNSHTCSSVFLIYLELETASLQMQLHFRPNLITTNNRQTEAYMMYFGKAITLVSHLFGNWSEKRNTYIQTWFRYCSHCHFRLNLKLQNKKGLCDVFLYNSVLWKCKRQVFLCLHKWRSAARRCVSNTCTELKRATLQLVVKNRYVWAFGLNLKTLPRLKNQPRFVKKK